MKITVIFHRLGPYHLARLSALAARCELTVIELSATDQVYAWEQVSHDNQFKRVTLVQSLDGSSDAPERLRPLLQKALEDAAPDAVAVPGWGFSGSLLALDWCLAEGVPALLMSESQATDHARSALKEGLKSFIVRQFSAALVGGKTSADYAASLGLPRERIFYGYDCVDNDYFQTGALEARAAAGLREKMQLPVRFWLASCRFIAAKNLPMLLRAYARYRSESKAPLYDLVLLGDGPLKAEILELQHALGLESSLHLPGFVQYRDLPSYYGLASAFLHVSIMEPWGLVVNEAMAASLPVLLSSACGCAPDLLRHGHNGYAFDPRDENALLKAMLDLGAKDAAALEAMGEAGQLMIQEFAPTLFASNMLRAAEAGRTALKPGKKSISRFMLSALGRRLGN